MQRHSKSQKVCKFYTGPKGCRFGSQCRFQHVGTVSSERRSGNVPSNTTSKSLTAEDARFRDWRFMIPKDVHKHHSNLGHRLPEFFQTAWSLFQKGSAEIQQSLIQLLASGGTHRIAEAVTAVHGSRSEVDRQQQTDTLLLPLLRILSHDSAMVSPLLESDVATVHNVLFGVGASRALTVYAALVEYLKTIDKNTESGSDDIIVILRFASKSVDINSNAIVAESLHPIIDALTLSVSNDLSDSAEASRLVNAIRSRIGLGQPIRTTVKSKNDKVGIPNLRFDIQRDLPGDLSTAGRRHDNDHEDIAGIEIMPTRQEIESSRSEYLPVKDPSQLHKAGLEGLIDRHFRLLREDTVGQLRDAVQEEFERLRNREEAAQDARRPSRDIRRYIYSNVRFEGIRFDTHLQCLVSFDQPDFLISKSSSHRQHWWGRRLGKDALVCALSQSGDIGYFCVCPDGNMNDKKSEDTRLDRLTNDRSRASVLLRLTEPHQYDVARMIRCFFHRQGQTELCEFPGILVPSFHPTLTALQSLSKTLDLPFSDLIAPHAGMEFDGVIPPPQYSLRNNFFFDLKAVAGGKTLHLSPKKKFDYQALKTRSGLDDTQQLAIVEALTRRLALIQGPPGTGKSYTGVSLIKVLLDNAKKAKLGPIVCVCYTNHALDQLLEHLVKDGVKQIIRIGARSKSEVLKPLNLREASKGIEQTAIERRECAQAKNDLKEVTKRFNAYCKDFIMPEMSDSAARVSQYLKTEKPSVYTQFFSPAMVSLGDDGEWQEVTRKGKHRGLKNWLPSRSRITFEEHDAYRKPLRSMLDSRNFEVWDLSIQDRQQLYNEWCSQIRSKAVSKATDVLDDASSAHRTLSYCRNESDLRCLNQANVIGITTSGLARNLGFLRRLSSKVLICEEAGEVLEAHLLTAMLPSIEHAILIGDHEQLRPQIQNNNLKSEYSHGQQYSLDLSLFERLARPTTTNVPQLPLSDLRTQRRMHPSISELIRSTIYPKLQDDTSVTDYPGVVGVMKRLFWINHNVPETTTGRKDSTSHSNDHEVLMTEALVSHIIRQGKYQSTDIAVLTPYRGQFEKLRRKLAASFAIVIGEKDAEELDDGEEPQSDQLPLNHVQKSSLLRALRIATVDNFQGEEAKIIIVSLVRSNQQRKCGFLKTSNRINVLLSRAQHGMYLIGDAETYRPVAMWGTIIDILERDSNIGPRLQLQCPRHLDIHILVSSPDQFAALAPEGGCNKMCAWRLGCGHACINKCHSPLMHGAVVCQEDCPRSLSGCEHPCQNQCGSPCGKCMVRIPDVILGCGHVAKSLPCYLAQDTSQARCSAPVDTLIPGCTHLVRLPCDRLPIKPDYLCSAMCGELLSCGHMCGNRCNQCNRKENGTLVSQNHGLCQAKCGRQYNTCGHSCQATCHGDEPCQLCKAPCEGRCPHSSCGKTCSEPCAPCSERCTWSCPHHGHCELPCAVPCNMVLCSRRCEKFLSCGHQCPSLCGEACPSSDFCQNCCADNEKERIVDWILSTKSEEIDLDKDPILIPRCGHLLTTDGLFEMHNTFEMSEGGHPTALKGVSLPFAPEDLKNCPMCRSPLRDINRYNRIGRRELIDESTEKFVVWGNKTFAPLTVEVQNLESEFANVESTKNPQLGTKSMTIDTNAESTGIKLHDGSDQFLRKAMRLRQDISAVLRQVGDSELPFGRIWDLVENERRRKGKANPHFPFQVDVLQTRSRLLTTSLLIRCNLAIVSDFLALRSSSVGLTAPNDLRSMPLDIDFTSARSLCIQLAEQAARKVLPLTEVEARIYFAQFAAFERSHDGIDNASTDRRLSLRSEGLAQLEKAETVSKQNRGSVKGMGNQIATVRRMLNDGVFYSVVTSNETQEVYNALAQEFGGTGHWYRCLNGHAFIVGECGRPMEQTVCPQCGSPVGGRNHQPAQGVTRFDDLERAMGNMALGDGDP